MSLNKKKTAEFTNKKRPIPTIKREDKENEFNENIQNKIGTWTEVEDNLLIEWVEKNGERDWNKCAKFIKTRTGKQCREHWNNKLNKKIKKGDWTPEEDLLIFQFYKKYRSWKAIIPIFENRSKNSIKNRYFSQLRKIANKKKIYGNSLDIAKMGLEQLKQLEDDAIQEIEYIYYYENKNITKEMFNIYMKEISDNFKFMRKGKFIDLNNIREKVFNRMNYNKNNNQFNDNDSISYDDLEEDKEINTNKTKGNKTITSNNKRKKMNEGKLSSQQSNYSFSKINKYSSIKKEVSKADTFRYNFFDNKTSLFGYPSKTQENNINNKNPLKNKKNSSNLPNEEKTFEIPAIPHKQKTNNFTNKNSEIKSGISEFFPHYENKGTFQNNFNTDNISFEIESAKVGKKINPCISFNNDSKYY